ncbi:hypothetical protein HYS94_00835 [Candidatus Daviesbacteria bacterium]|nr:hypothetical protein [Candidatus Daviesbacteria bacterium]
MPHIALIPLLIVITLTTGLLTIGGLKVDKVSDTKISNPQVSSSQIEGIKSDQTEPERVCKIISGLRFCFKKPISPIRTSFPAKPRPSPSSSPTTTPSSSPTSTPKPTSTPTSSPTATPNPQTGGPAAIGMTVESSNLSWWNERASSSDLIFGSIGLLKSVPSAKGNKVLFVDPNNPTSGMDTAKANGWIVTSNIEEVDVNYVISKEKEHYQLAKDRGLTFVFGPMGLQLKDHYADQDYALLKNTDIMVYQTQAFQEDSRTLGVSDSNSYVSAYSSKVRDLIGKIKPYIVQKKVWVQVSANPPRSRCINADRLIQYIDSISSGSNAADAVVIFVSPQYDSQCSEKRIDVAKKVVDHYR